MSEANPVEPTCSVSMFREWQKLNPEWTLICDMSEEETDALYVSWSELSKSARMHWVGKYGEQGQSMWNEYGLRPCKVERKVLNRDLELVDVWPEGPAMTVYRNAERTGSSRGATGSDCESGEEEKGCE